MKFLFDLFPLACYSKQCSNLPGHLCVQQVCCSEGDPSHGRPPPEAEGLSQERYLN